MKPKAATICFFHDVEQDIDSTADPERCRHVVEAFLDLERRHGVRATYNVVGKLFVEQPDLIDKIAAAGHELAFHSFHHQSDWCSAYYAKEIRLCHAVMPLVRGYRSPRSKWDEETLLACERAGFVWNAEADHAAAPYWIRPSLVRIPITGDDWPLHTGKMNLAQWQQRFMTWVRERDFVAFGCHDSVISFAPDERLAAWDATLRHARAAGATCLTFSEAQSLAHHGWLNRLYAAVCRTLRANYSSHAQ